MSGRRERTGTKRGARVFGVAFRRDPIPRDCPEIVKRTL